MTRKHYTAIARLLAELPDTATKRQLVLELALMFKSDNGRFSSSLFMKAAYPEQPTFDLYVDILSV